MNTTLVSGTGPGSKVGTEALIDALRGALRTNNSPIDHTDLNGQQLGFYRAVGISGATVSLAANAILAYLRWSDVSRVAAILRVTACPVITGAVTAAVPNDIGLFLSRGSSAAGSGGSALTLTGQNAKLRGGMGSTLVSDMRIASTTALTRPTGGTVDSNPLAATAFPLIQGVTATGTAVALPIGAGSPMQDLYKWDVIAGHPIILSPGAGETLEVQHIAAGAVTGTTKWLIGFEWAELAAF